MIKFLPLMGNPLFSIWLITSLSGESVLAATSLINLAFSSGLTLARSIK